MTEAVAEDGAIEAIQPGTGVENSVEDYKPSNTEYKNAGPGLGGVLRAMAAVGRYLDKME